MLRSFLTSLLGGGVIGGLVAAYAANKYAQSRERYARRLEFLGFLGHWRVSVLRCNRRTEVSRNFPEQVAHFAGAYVALEPDLWPWQRSKFHAMCDQIVAMTDAEVEASHEGELTGKTMPLKRIEAVIAFFG